MFKTKFYRIFDEKGKGEGRGGGKEGDLLEVIFLK